jgi:TolB-like protein
MSRNRTRIVSCLAVAALCAAPTVLTAQDDLPTVAVLDFTGFMMTDAGNSAPLGKAVSSMLITELSDRDGMRVIERYRIQDILLEQRLSLSGRVEEETAQEVGQMVGAQYVIHGQVTAISDQLRLDVRAVDVETSEVLGADKVFGPTADLLTMVVEIADQFSRNLELTPPSGRVEMEPIPVRATIEFSRGVDYEDKDDPAKAMEHYRAALEIHPDYAAARRALERLESAGSDA